MKWCLSILISLTLLFAPGVVEAKKKKSYALSIKIFRQMEEAQRYAEEEAYAEALAVLNGLLERKTTPYEKAQIHNLIGSVHYRNGDSNAALESFSKVLDSAGKMPVRLHQQTLKTLAQLHMANDDFETAKNYCEQVVAITEEPNRISRRPGR